MTIEETLNIINAYKEGKTIEYRIKLNFDLHKNPIDDWDIIPADIDYDWNFMVYDYRIKEEPKLRPYKDAKEFFQAMKEHGPYYIQIGLKEQEFYMLPGNVYNNGFQTWNDVHCPFIAFAQSYEWQDGTPCGILETDKQKSNKLNVRCNKKVSNNYEYVDLGLPSGTLWATCNVGAENPWEYGKYFQWGETKGYYDNEEHDFSWKGYKWCDGSEKTLTKYNNNSKLGSVDNTVDNKTTLDPEDDAAHVNMGGDWRMPTKDEIDELILYTNHSWVENYQGTGVNGSLFTSMRDGSKSIFIPASGYWSGYYAKSQGSIANLWDSTLYTDSPSNAWRLYFNSDSYGIYNLSRYHGFCVRGVL